ncbi:MAG: hypothetical protein H0U63_05940 [Burkholderiales bacterium]|nr:hypothetical protein [Burkholderiales bacterium]
MRALTAYSLDELKLIYSVLHAQLAGNAALMDTELLHDLQTYLQAEAQRAGVDVTRHGQWATWLTGGTVLKTVK